MASPVRERTAPAPAEAAVPPKSPNGGDRVAAAVVPPAGQLCPQTGVECRETPPCVIRVYVGKSDCHAWVRWVRENATKEKGK